MDDADGIEPGAVTVRRRAIPALAAFAAGLIAARHLSGVSAGTWFSLACGAAAVAAATGSRRRTEFVCAGALATSMALFGAGWFTLRIRETPAGGLAALLGAEARAAGDELDATARDLPGPGGVGAAPLLTVEGVLLDDPRPEPAPAGALAEFLAHRGERRNLATLALWRATGPDGPVRSQGRLTLITPAVADRTVAAGTWVRATGRFAPVPAPLNPGEPDRRMLAAQEGLSGRAGTLTLTTPPAIEPIDPAEAPWSMRLHGWMSRAVWTLRARASAALERAMGDAGNGGAAPSPARGVLRPILLGEYDAESAAVAAAFTRQGLVHILAISGFHLVVMAGVVLFLVRLTGDRGRLEPVVVGAAVVLYMLVVPANAPVLRAGIMVLAVMVVEATGRRYDRLNLLAWVAVGLLLWRPMDLWSLGWQLSFGIVAALLWAGRAFHDRLFPPGLRGVVRPRATGGTAGMIRGAATFARRRAGELVSTSLLCWLVAAPAIAHHSGQFSPLAVVTGLAVVPVATALLWVGFVALVAGMVVPAAAGAAGSVLTLLGGAAAGLVLWADQWPWMVWRAGPLSAAWAAAATAAVVCSIAPSSATRTRRLALPAVLAALAWLAVESVAAPRLAASGADGEVALRVDALSVGEGTCMLLRSGGDALLWDCGSRRPSIGLRTVPRALRALGVRVVRTAVLTGSSPERVAGILDAAEPMGLRRVVVSDAFLDAAERGPATIQRAIVRGLRARGVEVVAARAGDTLALGDASVEFVWPPTAEAGRHAADDSSLAAVVRVATAAGHRAMLTTGDNGPGALAAIADRAGRADVLELPRRRDAADAAAALLMACGVAFVIDSSSGGRAAHGGALAPLMDHREWAATGIDGAVTVEVVRSGSIRVRPAR